ncbi:Nudix family hydrolase [Amphritea pacifica]|uniref:Nudix family hydrolase n=1 Tax=Amphritea pacifica TaxID=2811233 RepID=UPI0019635837|nr:Nudix family hydrolase [Amphritea pacifica]MBN1007711.1 Nudix family hydrolase [Amphritea pacifica]
MSKLIHVAAAAIFNDSGELLLALRDKAQHQGGLWEFPGGKVEPGEEVRSALARELQEELGIEIDQSATVPLIQVPFHYPDKSVLLDVFRVNRFMGQPYGREGQPLNWVKLADLSGYQFPAANTPIVNALQLPTALAITPRLLSVQYCEYIDKALQKGAQAVMLRAKHLAETEQLNLYQQLAEAFPELLVIWNGSLDAANRAEVTALHLSSERLMQLNSRETYRGRWLGASCHTEEQIRRAEQIGADYITLSPVQKTASHPEVTPMGWAEYSRLVRLSSLPVYALGGVSLADLEQTLQAGGQGIAAIRCFC